MEKVVDGCVAYLWKRFESMCAERREEKRGRYGCDVT
jgi:hypothetical protein